MAAYELAANELLTCPFDETHRVKRSRYQLHIAKCELNHLDKIKDICPFNAQHRLERGMLCHHLMNCPDRAALDKKLVASDNSTFKGHTGVPSYNSPSTDSRENWDAELASCPMPGYQPNVEPPNGGIRVNFGRMQPAERKSYYRKLYSKESGEDAELEETLERRQDSLPELRKPSTVSYAQLLDQPKSAVHELQNIGLGRGQPIGSANSRIAANIFGDQAKPMRQPRTAPKIPGFNASNLALGRGIVVNGASERVGFATPVHEIDVNHIGLGRGAK